MPKITASTKYRRGQNPRSLANLKPFPPGVNGNPKPGNSLKAALMNALLEPLTKPPAGAPVRDHVVYNTLKGAIECEPTSAHLKEVWDRVEGKLQDTPPVTVDNRQVNIYVLDEETKRLLMQARERTRSNAPPLELESRDGNSKEVK